MKDGTLASWGLYPYHPQRPHSCHWRHELEGTIAELKAGHETFLPFGNGRSYGDSCMAASDQVLHMRALRRFITADWEIGRITAEAGMTLEELLCVTIPCGWFPVVTPGTKYATLGGAVANDVHGKNHHVRGSFGMHVLRFGLVRSDRQGTLVCSRQENADLFRATIGGLGLTGVIEWVEIQLIPIVSSLVDAQSTRFESVGEFFDLCDEFNERFEYTAAWVDCGPAKSSSGRGVFFRGNHASEGALKINTRRKLSVPFTPPLPLINGLSTRLFNKLYYAAHSGEAAKRVSYDPFFYPLDNVLHWNRIYGRRGFEQYQCVVPQAVAEAAVEEMLDEIAAFGGGSPLTVLKACGPAASPGLLSFPLKGVSLALDFPHDARLNAQLFPRLDAIVRTADGRLYPAKDAHMTGADFRAAYPAWEQVEQLRDPALCSRFWKRVMQS